MAAASAEITGVVCNYVVGNLLTPVLCASHVFIVLKVLHVPGAVLPATLATVFDLLPMTGWLLLPRTLELRPLLLFYLNFQPPVAHGFPENLVVAFALVRIGNCKISDGLVELIALAEIAADLRGLAAAGMRARQCPSAQHGILHHG